MWRTFYFFKLIFQVHSYFMRNSILKRRHSARNKVTASGAWNCEIHSRKKSKCCTKCGPNQRKNVMWCFNIARTLKNCSHKQNESFSNLNLHAVLPFRISLQFLDFLHLRWSRYFIYTSSRRVVRRKGNFKAVGEQFFSVSIPSNICNRKAASVRL
jgi:hypothetical protein